MADCEDAALRPKVSRVARALEAGAAVNGISIWVDSVGPYPPKFMDPNNRKQEHAQTIDVGIAIIDHPPNHHKWVV